MHVPLTARSALLTATVIWGSTFLITQNTLDAIDTYYLLAIRFSGAALLLGLLFHRACKAISRAMLSHGTLLGLILFAAYVLQTEALKRTTPGRTAFLSAVDCVAVPFLGWMFTRHKPNLFNLSAALFCLGGVGCISLEGGSAKGLGDLLALGCGILFAAHIENAAHSARKYAIIPLTVIQFAVSGALAWLFAFAFNSPPKHLATPTMLSLAYLCLFATAFAFLCQYFGQKHISPASAALILSLEAVFGVIFAALFAHEPLTPMMLVGFGLIFLAMLVAEVIPRWYATQ